MVINFMFIRRIVSVICSFLALAIIIYGIVYYNPIKTNTITYDYFVWISTALAVYSFYIDLKDFSNKPVYSTMFLGVMGILIVVLGRTLSYCLNAFTVYGYIGHLVGESYTINGFKISLLIVPGSICVLITSIINTLFGEPLILLTGFSFRDLYAYIIYTYGKLSLKVDNILSRSLSLLALIAFAIGFTYRFIPEIYYWPYLIGWDTVEYVAHLADFLEKLNPFTSYYWMGGLRNCPPLLNILLTPFTFLVDPWVVFKFYPSLAFGILASLSAIIVVKVYNKSWKIGLLAAIATTVFILNLRISWDYQRQLLGSIFMLASIIALELWEIRSFSKAVTVSILLISCGLSHEVTGLVGFVLALTLLYKGFKTRNTYSMITGLIALVCNTILEVWYWGKPYSYVPSLGYTPPGITNSSGVDASEALSYFIAGYGLVLPLAILALTKYSKQYIVITTTTLLLAGLSPLITPASSIVTWYRFLIGWAPLASSIAVVSLIDVSKNWKTIAIYMIIFSLPGLAFTYNHYLAMNYTMALREFPWRLTPSPPQPYAGIYLDVYNILKQNQELLRNIIVIADASMARYVHLLIRNPDPSKLVCLWYLKESINKTVCSIAEELNLSKVLFIISFYNEKIVNTGCISKVETLNNEYPWIALIEITSTKPNQ